MVNVEILEGLKAGLERGQSLKRAMMSFFNAGYKREEIEEAARALSQVPIQKEIVSQPKINVSEKKKFSILGKFNHNPCKFQDNQFKIKNQFSHKLLPLKMFLIMKQNKNQTN